MFDKKCARLPYRTGNDYVSTWKGRFTGLLAYTDYRRWSLPLPLSLIPHQQQWVVAPSIWFRHKLRSKRSWHGVNCHILCDKSAISECSTMWASHGLECLQKAAATWHNAQRLPIAGFRSNYLNHDLSFGNRDVVDEVRGWQLIWNASNFRSLWWQ